MDLLGAPYLTPLRILSLESPTEEARVLRELGFEEGEVIQKKHSSPLGDPIAVLVGSHLFTLRSEVCSQIKVLPL